MLRIIEREISWDFGVFTVFDQVGGSLGLWVRGVWIGSTKQGIGHMV